MKKLTVYKSIMTISNNKIFIMEQQDNCIYEIKHKCNEWITDLFKKKQTYTKPGSISHLLFGSKPSDQSINIKMGYLGEFISKELIKQNKNLELLTCGNE
jgi:hypothetical protein